MNMEMGMLLSAATEGYERLFDLDFQLLSDSLLTIIAVFVLFLVLSYNLFNPARKILEERKNRIQNDITTAQNDKDAALAMKEEYELKEKAKKEKAEKVAKTKAEKIAKDKARRAAEKAIKDKRESQNKVSGE